MANIKVTELHIESEFAELSDLELEQVVGGKNKWVQRIVNILPKKIPIYTAQF